MHVYLITTKEKGQKAAKHINNAAEVTVLDSGATKLKDYSELFENQDEKIIGLSPGLLDWKAPTQTLKRIPNLKGLCTLSSWAHYVDIYYCNQNDIVVTNTPGANSQAVAEYAMWMMLSLARKLPLQMQDNFQTTIDQAHLQTEMKNKTAGIIGLGNIGRRIASMTHGIGMQVIYWSPNSRNDEYDYHEFDQVMQQADVIFNCVETYEPTKGLFSKDKLNLLKPTAFFISVLGGAGWGSVDFDHVIHMLNQEKLAGAAVENGHAEDYQLPDVKPGKNLFIPAIYAYYTQEAQTRSLQKWAQAINGIITGEYKYQVQ